MTLPPHIVDGHRSTVSYDGKNHMPVAVARGTGISAVMRTAESSVATTSLSSCFFEPCVRDIWVTLGVELGTRHPSTVTGIRQDGRN